RDTQFPPGEKALDGGTPNGSTGTEQFPRAGSARDPRWSSAQGSSGGDALGSTGNRTRASAETHTHSSPDGHAQGSGDTHARYSYGEHSQAARSGYAPDGGLVVLRENGRRVTMDVGPLGYLSIAAHGHADALAVTLAVDGSELICDPGTASYYGHPNRRAAHRSTRAHATVTVDGLDQSVMGGPFIWSEHARVRVRAVDLDRGVVDAEHDGYRRLADPVAHRRWLIAPPDEDLVLVVDMLAGTGIHSAQVSWPLHPALQVRPIGDGYSTGGGHSAGSGHSAGGGHSADAGHSAGDRDSAGTRHPTGDGHSASTGHSADEGHSAGTGHPADTGHPMGTGDPVGIGHWVSRAGEDVLSVAYAATAPVTPTRIRGDENTDLGWWSELLESREPAWLIGAHCSATAPFVLVSALRTGAARVRELTVNLAGDDIQVRWRQGGAVRTLVVDIRHDGAVAFGVAT
uniref:heparinase II/III family protein n=1 Tax=Nocardia jejuensis TaxID=328049 RepID=UPI000AB1A115